MKLCSKLIATCSFLFITVECIIAPECPPKTYPRVEGSSNRCCKSCPPGTFLEGRCFKGNTSKCTRCPDDQFTDSYNTYVKCIGCRECPVGTFLKKSCTKSSDTVCNCIKGHFYKRISNTCEPCKDCKPGEGMVDDCTLSTKRTCENCVHGVTFSDKFNGHCKPCRDCGVNIVKTANCTVIKDTKCSSAPVQEEPSSIEWKTVVIVGTICLLIICMIIAVIFSVRKKLPTICYKRGDQPRIVSTKAGVTAQRSCTGDGQVQIRVNQVSEPEEIIDNGKCISEVPHPDWEELAKKLDPEAFRHKNWRSLAGRLSYNQIDILNFGRDDSPTLRVLMEYQTQKDCTIFKVYKELVKMKREDCARVLKPYLISERRDV